MTLMLTRSSASDMQPKPQSEQRPPFAKWLVEKRTARGWSQDNLVDNADGITQGYISSLERGVRQPSRDIIRTLARALYMGDSADGYAVFEAGGMESAGYMPDNEEYVKRTRHAMVIAEAYWNLPARDKSIVDQILYTDVHTGQQYTMDDINQMLEDDK